MQKFPKVRYPSDPQTDGLKSDDVVVTEKLDGANFRFSWDEDGELVIGTRNHVYAHDDENLPNAFKHAVKYIQSITDGWERPGSDITLYGEAMHLHSLEYEDIDWETSHKGSPHVPLDSEIPNVVLFDARRNGQWIPWDTFVNMVDNSPFELTRVLERGDPAELSFEIPDESMFGGPPEGIIARRIDGRIRAKKVTDEFKEQNAVSFEDPSKAQSDAGQFVASFVTDARIMNIAHKLVDEGEYEQLEMAMMEDLPREVLVDTMSEVGWELLSSGGFEGVWDDDFKHKVRSKTSKKCARNLKTELQSF